MYFHIIRRCVGLRRYAPFRSKESARANREKKGQQYE
jgi:hypothetical protein